MKTPNRYHVFSHPDQDDWFPVQTLYRGYLTLQEIDELKLYTCALFEIIDNVLVYVGDCVTDFKTITKTEAVKAVGIRDSNSVFTEYFHVKMTRDILRQNPMRYGAWTAQPLTTSKSVKP